MRKRIMAGWDFPVLPKRTEQNGNALLDILGGEAVDMSIDGDNIYLIGKSGQKVCVDKDSILLVFNTILQDECEDFSENVEENGCIDGWDMLP